ncbi:MAG: conditioned medium factor [Gammaproteobacteria bacterium CG22_combo_CG10-13_8_21_14_all_40_8]|nr:MAG: conditioned medium factor [Gammaproteobacteria bacterium CG22_combo_CG10-13_8_21_14_all_40_8]
MSYYKILASTISVLALSTFSASAYSAPVAKQLAGPSEEFSQLQTPDPQLSAIQSKTAMIPVQFKNDGKGNWTWQSDLAIDNKDLQMLILAKEQKDWSISLRDPVTQLPQNLKEAEFHPIDSVKSDSHQVKFGMEGAKFPAVRYGFKDIESGHWTLQISTHKPEALPGFVVVGGNEAYQLRSFPTENKQIVGHPIHFVTQGVIAKPSNTVFNQAALDEQSITSLSSNPLLPNELIEKALLKVTDPDGSKHQYAMYDDGLHGDKLPNDGVYGADFTPAQKGNYQVQIQAQGTNPEGNPFLRTTEHLVPIVEQTIDFDQKLVQADLLENQRLIIQLPMVNQSQTEEKETEVGEVTEPAHYRLIAEVWGYDAMGRKMIPVSWISTIAPLTKDSLALQLDERWVQRAKAQGPFELRNLRIEETENYIPLVNVKRLSLSLSKMAETSLKTLALNKTASFDAITHEMRMGVKPDTLQKIDATTQALPSSGLMLVHGYCSGDVWGPVASQFSNAVVFSDLNANRSHDEFARKIRDFGASMNSYGIVAHSQGGDAALHLYTYYWSGLDNASGNRMIQSLGTPYQGTPLAGNLAALGSVFGVGCGTNANLTTSGAASWLAGIPSWARDKVYYSTTSFTTKWWRYDYCSVATDLFLSDPEDGVVEKSRGQLSGGHNMGHKTGWCHTSGMRDPAQTKDSSRNSDMNANAMR